jgi:hypothetical protein
MTYPETTSLDDVQPGYGIIRVVVGGPVALAAAISYTCDYVFGGQTFENVPGQIPAGSRYPAPIMVRAHEPNLVFPAYAIRGDTGYVVQPFMPPEMPNFVECGGAT